MKIGKVMGRNFVVLADENGCDITAIAAIAANAANAAIAVIASISDISVIAVISTFAIASVVAATRLVLPTIGGVVKT